MSKQSPPGGGGATVLACYKYRHTLYSEGTRGRGNGYRKGRPLTVDTAAPSAVELANAVTDQLRDYLSERRRDCAYIGADYGGPDRRP